MHNSARGGLLPVALAAALGGAGTLGTLTTKATADAIVLKSSTPRNGATVSKVPTTIRLRFSVKPSKPNVKVISPDGDNHTRSARVSGRTVIVRMRGHEKGRYNVTYRVSSPDGDPNRGSISFTVR
jgi:methionine-rich copper-binding protein CopC